MTEPENPDVEREPVYDDVTGELVEPAGEDDQSGDDDDDRDDVEPGK